MAKFKLGGCVEATIHFTCCIKQEKLDVYLCERAITTVSPTVIRFIKKEGEDKRIRVLPMHAVSCIVVTDAIVRELI